MPRVDDCNHCVQRKRVVCVDDEPNVLEALRRSLRPMQRRWETFCTNRPEEAWQRVRQGQIDLLLTDVKMPGIDGLELIARVRSHEPTRDLPVVVMTGLNEPGLKEKALMLGAIDLLYKPVDSRELTARIESALRLKERWDRLKADADRLRAEAECARREAFRARWQMVCRLGRIAEHHDPETGNHVARVAAVSCIIAAALGLPKPELEVLLLAAPLHDLGKIAIPERIIAKAGPLSDYEWAIMRRHCEYGAALLREQSAGMAALLDVVGHRHDTLFEPDPFLETAARIAAAHHERWDGSGYPHGLRGEAIPLEARIVAVADVFDALLSPRPYKKPYCETEAMETMRAEAGRHFDPAVFAAFERSIPSVLAARRRWSDGAILDLPESHEL